MRDWQIDFALLVNGENKMLRSAWVASLGVAIVVLGAVAGATAQQPSPAQVADLTAKLSSPEHGPQAADQLALLDAKAAVPALVRALGTDYPTEVRWRAARALGTIGPAASDAVGTLILHLRDPNERVRAYACYALGRIGGEAGQAAAPSIVERVTDENGVVRRAAVDALLLLRPDRQVIVPLMIKALEDADPRIAMDAVRALTSEGATMVPLLVEALGNKNSQYWAAVALENLGPDAAPAVPSLTPLLAHEEPEMRMQVLMTLAAIGEAAKPAASQIAQRLAQDDLGGVRYAAAYALGKINPGTAADAALTAATTSDDPMLAMLAAWALAKAHPNDAQIAQRAVERVVAGLQSENPQVQAAAARALAESTLPSEITQPAIERALETASPQVVAQAVQVLAAQGARAVPRVARALKNEKLRKHAIQVLAQIGPEAAPAVPDLLEAMQTADPQTQSELQFALAAIGPAAAAAVPQLTASLKAENEEVRHSAAYALGRIGPQARAALSELMKMRNADDEFSRIAAAWAMTRIDPTNPEVVAAAVPLLAKALQADREEARVEAASTLGEMGAPAKAALPALKQALADSSAAVRDAARTAIQRIEGGGN